MSSDGTLGFVTNNEAEVALLDLSHTSPAYLDEVGILSRGNDTVLMPDQRFLVVVGDFGTFPSTIAVIDAESATLVGGVMFGKHLAVDVIDQDSVLVSGATEIFNPYLARVILDDSGAASIAEFVLTPFPTLTNVTVAPNGTSAIALDATTTIR